MRVQRVNVSELSVRVRVAVAGRSEEGAADDDDSSKSALSRVRFSSLDYETSAAQKQQEVTSDERNEAITPELVCCSTFYFFYMRDAIVSTT
jgi:hypothetical protein